jgi:hypothetical protein
MSISPSPKYQTISSMKSISPSMKNMSIPPSPKNQAISPFMKNVPLPPSTGNRPIAPSRMKQFVTPSDIDVSGAHSDLLGVSGGYSTGDKSGIQLRRSHAERRIFRIASDRRAGPRYPALRGATEGDADPQSVVEGEDMKTWIQVVSAPSLSRSSWELADCDLS